MTALTNEFDRISKSTTFNGLNLLDGSLSGVTLQSGYGTSGSLSISLAEQFGIKANTGTFSTSQTFTVGSVQGGAATGDFNGDGSMDFTTLAGSELVTFLGNGDGSFIAPRRSISGGIFSKTADLNNDGKLDVVVSGFTGNVVGVNLGNGDGSFQQLRTYTGGSSVIEVNIADMNGDGIFDLVESSYADTQVSIHIGNGDGTFKALKSYEAVGILGSRVGDVNRDGILDVIGATGGGISVLYGNSDGSLRFPGGYDVGTSMGYVAVGDLNYDGILDAVGTGVGSNVFTFIGNADGSFRLGGQYAASMANGLVPELTDMNGDAFLDVVAACDVAAGGSYIVFGNGDGTFKAGISKLIGGNTFQAATADFNGDGSIEMVVASNTLTAVTVLQPDTQLYTGLARVNIASKQTARQSLDVLKYAGRRLSLELGLLGSQQSRIDSARANISQMRAEFDRAASQILDVDVGEESSRLARLNILQRSAQSVLASANQTPALVLQLLSG